MGLPTSFTPDANLEMKDAGLIAADAAWQVSAANKIIDLGAAVYTPFDVHVEVTAIEVGSNDELYELAIQVSSSATFASTIHTVALLPLGANEVLLGDVDSVIGHYVIRCHNDIAGTAFRYVRGYTDVTGTIATGINFFAWMDGATIP
jgi:hypothetical protein